ncbi:hypothetical protein BJF84_10420 [Rhodococcus sp. CUA-806]|nr:hypothetical protein BJF84_10420 [Rhodococcus sp. CUA-806]
MPNLLVYCRIHGVKWEWTKLRSAVSLTVAGVVLVTGCSPVADDEGSTQSATAEIQPGVETTVDVTDSWSIALPAGAVESETTLSVSPAPASFSTDDVELIDSAEITLASGQPLVPLVFQYRMKEPIPDDRSVYLIGSSTTDQQKSDPDQVPEPDIVIEAQLDEDRLVATAEAPHLSVWGWMMNGLATFAGQRGSTPSCDTQPRPPWMDDVIYLEDQNAPLLVCTGADENDPNIAVVKIRNNRGVAMTVTSPVVPSWASANLWGGQISSIVSDILTQTTESLGVPPDERNRAWVLPPGGGVDIGYTRQSLEPTFGVAKIETTVSTASVAYGLIWTGIEAAVNDPTTLTALEAGMMTVCASDASKAVATASDPVQLVSGASELVGCAASKIPDVLWSVKANLPASVWNSLVDKGLYKKSTSITAVLKKMGPVLAIGNATVVVGDVLGTMALSSGAFDITMFTEIARRLPNKPPVGSGCPGTVSNTADIEHPTLGTVRAFLVLPDDDGPMVGCVAFATIGGSEIPPVTVGVYGDAFQFADPPTDSTGNTFVTYNPGRYDGVLVLIPTADGFEDPGVSGNEFSGRLAYYYAELEGPGSNGQYAIRQSSNDCEPDCAGGTITDELLTWNGQEYVA